MDSYLHYPNDMDKSLNESGDDKIRKYRSDYNNNPPGDGRIYPFYSKYVWEVT